MDFKEHLSLTGKHAVLSASNSSWINYDDDKFDRVLDNLVAAQIGSELHEYARMAIRRRRQQPENGDTLNMYINDAIGFNMTPEQILFVSTNCFGTADALSFRRKFLRIHDYKSGEIISGERQLKVYAAMFCLEYEQKPHLLEGLELRVYQNDEIRIYAGDEVLDEVARIMSRIVVFNERINLRRQEKLL